MSAPVAQQTAVQLEHAAAFFTREKPRLLGIAHRIVVNAADAEDVVQDVWVRWQNCDRRAVQAPAAFLATAATRLAINSTQSARARHETALAPRHSWLADSAADPVAEIERRESVESAIGALLGRLSPAERAAYLLHEVFGYPYPRIAEIIQATQPTTRQVVSRARKRLATQRGNPVRGAKHRGLLKAFLAAARTGQFSALERLLTADVLRTTRKRRHLSVSQRHVMALGRAHTGPSEFSDAA